MITLSLSPARNSRRLMMMGRFFLFPDRRVSKSLFLSYATNQHLKYVTRGVVEVLVDEEERKQRMGIWG